MPSSPPPAPARSRRTTWIIAAALAAVLAIGGAAYWISQPSYDDIVKDCQHALVAQSKAGGKGKPSACEDVKEDDYTALVVSTALDGMPKKDRDMLDYFDNGTIDGSVG
ncbi:hypothetical protein ACWERY_16160 [Streptomyces sp. NPDC004082]